MQLRFAIIYILCMVMFVAGIELKAQPPPAAPETDVNLEQLMEDVAESSAEEADLSELIEQRRYYALHPLDINNASYEELMESGLINDLLAQALLMHINQFGKLMTVEELQSINGFDLNTIRSLQPYITVRPEPDLLRRGFKEVLKNGKHQFIVRTQQVLEEQKGYSEREDPDDTRYEGSPLKLYSRYRFTFGNKISAGITGEKDAGEDFFAGEQKNGFDFYTAHLYIKEGNLKALAVGDYQVKYGQGLVMWSGLAAGKSSDVVNIKRNSTGIRPYTSVNEFSYLRGAAASYGIKKFTLDAFFSSRKIDASTGVVDSVNEELLITSFAEDGYHRTLSEAAKKNAVGSMLAGGHINYRSGFFEAGVTGFYNEFDVAIEKNDKLYNRYDASGKEFSNIGIHYSYSFRNMLLFGETARSGNNATATINGLMMSLDKRAALSVLYRNYSREFEILYNNAFRESDNANERGLYIGISLNPLKGVVWNNYVDFFTFPWLRFGVDAPSYGTEWLSQVTWTPDRKTTLYVKFKQQDKQENSGTDEFIPGLETTRQRNIRFNASYKISASFTLQSRVELNLRKTGDEPVENGTVFFQDIKYNALGSPVSIALRYAVFDTDSYDTRIYTYENDIPGVFSIPSYYYKGSRVYALIRWKVTRDIDFWARYGLSSFSNRDAVGSGLEEINGPKKSDLKLQVRFEF